MMTAVGYHTTIMMEDQFLDDLVKILGESRDASESPMRERSTPRDVSKSPVRGRGGTPVSMRERDATRSPTRNGDVRKSPLQEGLGPDFTGNSVQEMARKMPPNDSFKSSLPDGKHEGQSGDDHPSGRRSTWRDRAVVRPDQKSEGIKSAFPDENGLTSEGSLGNSVHGIGPSKEQMSQDEGFNSVSAIRYARPIVIDRPSNYPRMAHTGPQGQSSHPAHHHKRLEVVSQNRRLCCPILGGAPFVVCDNCIELLQIPGNFKAKHKNQRLQCGACSAVISPNLRQKSFDAFSSEKDSVQAVDGSSEKQLIDKDISQEGSSNITDESETELPVIVLPTTSLPQDSGDIPRESLVPENDSVTESRIDDLLEGFDSLTGPSSPEIVEVYVNGQAISWRMVMKAEKRAGPIQPGVYWYDQVAGFWGVMGHQCLGILPTFIEEFSFPMPENCSGGHSNIFVNGRELRESDLRLLVGRGLPTEKGKRYIVHISGKVEDEETRNLVVELRKLARKVEKRDCGFGMYVPEQLG